ncbi:unnamed protein product [Clonostachys byssicola]|uniref:Glucose-methanol-choline oxidoreductase N-terminal domain-containing protein n=1 Tax=Clonostachys byssicola TaxID=160290 RepID=A0A9N9UN40_9HYPO|nr:unnamed protein product [Clonostachys byssicola]
MTTNELRTNDFDFIIVGGGTAGCVVASRLTEYLPNKKVLLIEGGPSDYEDDRVLLLKDWLKMLGGDMDYDYGTTEQPRGNSHIRHSRAKVLGGCSSHNTLISFRPFEYDCDRWVARGAIGWDFKTFTRVLDNLRNTIQPVSHHHQNQINKDWLEASSKAFNIPIVPDFNKEIVRDGNLSPSAGFLSVAYNPSDGRRSSASVAYIHPILQGSENRPNLTILTNAWVSKVNVEHGRANGVNVTLQNGEKQRLFARAETILCAGAIDSPRLLLHSGLGPRQQLTDLGIPVISHLPGVGENLMDHPETIIIWELNRPAPEETVMSSDAAVFLRREPYNAAGDDKEVVDMMFHCYQIPFCLHTERLGYDKPTDAFCMIPNVPRSRSRGRVYLTSAEPSVKPALDFRYFTDPDGYDEATIVESLKVSREVAKQEPFKSWIKREVAPGPKVQSDEDLSEYGRRVASTVYHPCGTLRMGNTERDELAVVGPDLRLKGIGSIRVADASVFPEIPTINPMVTVLGVGERCAELVAQAWGWRGLEGQKL